MTPGLIGIDLGTCFSAVGYRGPHGVTFLKDPGAPQLSYSIPSSILMRPDGGAVFGALAESEKSARPEYYQAQFKRDLGSRVPYQLGPLTISSAEMTQKFLSFLVELATAATGRAPAGGVITVPAEYDAFRCSLVETAALAAGLSTVHLVPEPVAALVAAADRDELPQEGIVLVYDLGGGTFDAALVRVEGPTREVLATRGMADFGGTDIDRMIEGDLARKAGAEFAELLAGGNSEDPQTRTRALRARLGARDLCRDVKHRLSSVDLVQTDLFLRIPYELSRGDLVDMVRPELERTLATCHRLLADAGLTDKDVSGVLLTGGGSRMPIVRELLQRSMGRPVWPASDPEMVVCAGATVLAESRAARSAGPQTNPGLASLPGAIRDALANGTLSTHLVASALATIPATTGPTARSLVSNALQTLRGERDAYFAPNIPPRKLANATASANVPTGDEVLLLVDMTVFGGARDAMTFTTDTLYYRHMYASPRTAAVRYKDLPAKIQASSEITIELGDRSLTIAGTTIPAATLVDVLAQLRAAAVTIYY